MPRGDRTGPTGMGAMSGRGAGYCAGAGMFGFADRMPGCGFGMSGGRASGLGGGGGGWRHRFHVTGLPGRMRFRGYGAPNSSSNTEMEKQALKSQADALQAELERIQQRLQEWETKTETP